MRHTGMTLADALAGEEEVLDGESVGVSMTISDLSHYSEGLMNILVE